MQLYRSNRSLIATTTTSQALADLGSRNSIASVRSHHKPHIVLTITIIIISVVETIYTTSFAAVHMYRQLQRFGSDVCRDNCGNSTANKKSLLLTQ